MLVDHEPRQTPATSVSRPDAAPLPRIDSTALLGPRGEVLIVHHQQVYRLRVTSLGKLILTK